MGDLSDSQTQAMVEVREFIDALEITPMTKSFKMVVLLAMLNRDKFPGAITINELMKGFIDISGRSATLKEDVGPLLENHDGLQRLIEDNPISAWTEGRGTGGKSFFSYSNNIFNFKVPIAEGNRNNLQEFVRELVEWRLAEYLQRGHGTVDVEESKVLKVSHSGGKPIIFLDREKYTDLAAGWTNVLIDGELFQANFVKVAINVIQRTGSEGNELPALLRRWFGPDAGLPGTGFRVVLEQEAGIYTLKPLNSPENRNQLELWRNYPREQIPPLFGEKFSTALWNVGFVVLPGHLFLLVTLNKGQMTESFQYQDRFIDQNTFEWQSQNRTTQASKHGQIVKNHRERGIQVHLFVRKNKRLAASRSAPFVYCGELEFIDWERDQPITVKWRLLHPIPARLLSNLTS